jgi:ABC-type bacteriocin/lantibiotic exporter with double-glycine peptidase domain
MQFIMFGSLDLLVYFAAYLNSNDGLTIGEFTSFQFYFFAFIMNFSQFTNVISEVFGVFGTTAAIAEIFLHESKVNTTGGDHVTQDSLDDGAVSLKDIQFKYPTRQDIQVIQNADIVVPKNKTVALVGTSGCGKSTIIQLIERFYDPDVGSVHYGKQNIRELNPVNFKKNMAIVQ